MEYAAKAVESSGTAVGVRCKDGVVLGFEKLVISKMLVEVHSAAHVATYGCQSRKGWPFLLSATGCVQTGVEQTHLHDL